VSRGGADVVVRTNRPWRLARAIPRARAPTRASVIHPSQIVVLNEEFRPSPGEVEREAAIAAREAKLRM
jgi:citrate lyase beta subunit